MLSLLNLPSLPYLVFELLRYKVETQPSGETIRSAESIDTLLMDINPEIFDYAYSARQSYNSGEGDNNTRNIKGGNAPTKISIEGTFGQKARWRGIKLMNGFGRQKEFIAMFKKSNSLTDVIEDKLTDEFRYVYGLNYYDFNHHEWGAISLDTLRIKSNARAINGISSYTVSFTLFGDLITAVSKDPLIRNLRFAIEVQKKLDEANQEIENFLNNNAYASELNDILVTYDFYSTAIGDVVALANSPFFPLTLGRNILPTTSFTSFANLLG